jgi:hypothetical protein
MPRRRGHGGSTRGAWDCFVAWCEQQGRAPLPALPDTVALYLTARAEGHTVATIEQDLFLGDRYPSLASGRA